MTVVLALGCAGWPPWGPPIQLQQELAGEEAAAANEMAIYLVHGRFPSDVAADCETNAARFTWLAARHPDPQVVVASLLAAAGCDDPVPEDLPVVVAVRLGGGDEVRNAALVAARTVVATVPPHDPVIARLVALASAGRPEVRYEALQILDARAWSQETLIESAFLAALREEEPWLVSEALRRLRYRAAGLADPSPFVEASARLLADRDPGIRGRAALLLARLAPEDPEVVERLIGMLDDPHPYTRSAAAEALGDTGASRAIHALVERIDDHEKSTWDMKAFTRLDGTREVTHHVGSHFERVDDAYLRAIVALSEPMGDDAFVYREINLRYRDLDIIAATRDAKKWYAAHQEQIPEEPPDETPEETPD